MKPRLDDFLDDVKGASGLIVQTVPSLPRGQGDLVRELAFLRCVNAWETFLEESLIVYLSGGTGLSGKTAKTKVIARTGVQARAVLLGSHAYLTWSSRDVIRDRAKAWITDGQPYLAALKSLSNGAEIRKVRNRVAHNSRQVRDQFNQLAVQTYPKPADRHGMGPGRFLALPANGHQTRFDAYVSDLSNAAKSIAKN